MQRVRTSCRAARAARVAFSLALAALLAFSAVPTAGLFGLEDVALAAEGAEGDEDNQAVEGNQVGDAFTVGYGDAGSIAFKVTASCPAAYSEPLPEGSEANRDAFGEVSLASATAYVGESLVVDYVYQVIDGAYYYYSVTSIASAKLSAGGTLSEAGVFEGNTTLKSVEVKSNLTGAYPAVGHGAFKDCASLESVLLPEEVAGIGRQAFEGCTKLATIKFAEGAELYAVALLGSASAIGAEAFKGCSSLRSVSIPAITSATRTSTVYASYKELNPSSHALSGVNGAGYVYPSGMSGYWHNGLAVAAAPGISPDAFDECSALETVVFKAGSYLGAFAYFEQSSIFQGCTSLKNLVFECAQAFRTNPNGSFVNGQYSDAFDSYGDSRPSLYYAVDYYATADVDEVASDGPSGSGRISRVEFARETPVALLQAGSSESLEAYVYADASAYAVKEHDGIVPDPNEAAADAGLDTSVSWAWKLTDSQSRREKLTESCRAYLVPSNDMAAGRLSYAAAEAMQKRCDIHFSQSPFENAELQDTTFDPVRFYDPKKVYGSGLVSDNYIFDDEAFLVISGEGFFQDVSVRAGDGSEIDPNMCEVTFRRWDSDAGKLAEPEEFSDALLALGEGGGPLLVSIKAGDESGYVGELHEWVLVRGYAGSVKTLFTDNAGLTPDAASHYAKTQSMNAMVDFSSAPYAVGINPNEPAGALLAASYAGLGKGEVRSLGTDSSLRGFTLVRAGDGQVFSYDAGDKSYAYLAVAAYTQFTTGLGGSEPGRAELGADAWGDTAIVVDPRHVNDVAAAAATYAYAACAPVFYLEDDGTLGDGTLDCLKEGFTHVVAIGDAGLFSEEAFASLEQGLADEAEPAVTVERIEGDAGSACALSLAVAERLADASASDGKAAASVSMVAICDGSDPVDSVGSLNFAGHEGGVVLTSSSAADSKRISAWLADRRYEVGVVCLFGRSESNALTEGFDLGGSIACVWDHDYEAPAIGEGDTVALYGVQLAIGQDGALQKQTDLWPHAALTSGEYCYDGATYALASVVDPYKWKASISVNPVGPAVPANPVSDLMLLLGKDSYDVPTTQWISPNPYLGSSSHAGNTSNSGSSGNSTSNSGGQGTSTSSGQPSVSFGAVTVSNAGTTTSSALSLGTTSPTTSGSTSNSGNLSLDLGVTQDNPSDGWLDGSLDGVEPISETTTSDGVADASSLSSGRAWNDSRSGDEGQQPGDEGQQSEGISPVLVGILVALAVMAAGCALWYALRRRSGAGLGSDLEFME